jgi:hypothetical protein
LKGAAAMVKLSTDFNAHVMLASMAGGQTTAEHERVYAAIAELDRSGHGRNAPIGFVYLVGRDNPAPDAHWRRRFAEQRKTFASPRVYLSIVTQSALMRGVLTAMNWVVPEPRNMTSVTHSTFEDCATWIERVQGTPRAVLRRLRDEALPTAGEAEHTG